MKKICGVLLFAISAVALLNACNGTKGNVVSVGTETVIETEIETEAVAEVATEIETEEATEFEDVELYTFAIGDDFEVEEMFEAAYIFEKAPLREGPAKAYDKIATVPADEYVLVVGKVEDSNWYYIETLDNEIGYVFGKHLTFELPEDVTAPVDVNEQVVEEETEASTEKVSKKETVSAGKTKVIDGVEYELYGNSGYDFTVDRSGLPIPADAAYMVEDGVLWYYHEEEDWLMIAKLEKSSLDYEIEREEAESAKEAEEMECWYETVNRRRGWQPGETHWVYVSGGFGNNMSYSKFQVYINDDYTWEHLTDEIVITRDEYTAGGGMYGDGR